MGRGWDDADRTGRLSRELQKAWTGGKALVSPGGRANSLVTWGRGRYIRDEHGIMNLDLSGQKGRVERPMDLISAVISTLRVRI